MGEGEKRGHALYFPILRCFVFPWILGMYFMKSVAEMAASAAKVTFFSHFKGRVKMSLKYLGK